MNRNYLTGKKCAALWCSSNSKEVKFFRFPRNSKERYKKWSDIAKNPKLDVDLMTSSYLCANHFESNQFRDSSKTTLIFGAVPVAEPSSDQQIEEPLPTGNDSVISETFVHSTPKYRHSCATKLVFTENIEETSISETLCSSLQMQISDTLPNVDSLLESPNVSEDADSIKKKKKTVMKDINCSRFKYLTPRKKLLVRRCQKKERSLKLLQKKYKDKKITLEQMCAVDSDTVKLAEYLSKSVSLTTARFIASQVRCSNVKSQGRRWSDNDKLLALVIYKRSPKAYAFLRTIFVLPSKRTLIKLLNKIPFCAGIDQRIFASLKSKLCTADASDRTVVLTFDEISIREHLQYDATTDRIIGYEDLGSLGRTERVANHALVFMLKGLKGNWKQPVAYFFTRDGMPAAKLVVMIKDVIAACHEVGLLVAATVCDMASSNVSALKSMGVTTERPYFIFNDLKIVTIFDPPHLLKCLRNMLFKHNVQVKVRIGGQMSSGTAKWQHILNAYEIDKKQTFFNLLYKLTKEHLNPTGFKAMKVSLAAQLLSHTVAATIECLVANGAMSSEAIFTAHFVGFTNKLFDSVNGSSMKPSGAQGLKCQLRKERENLHLSFWDAAVEEVDSWQFERLNAYKRSCSNDSKSAQYFRPPCQDGWIITLRGLKELWSNLNEQNFLSLKVRSVNQDSLEHLFGLVRLQCGSNNNPTVPQFEAALKSCIVNGLATEKLKGHNCEASVTSFEVLLDNLHSFLSDTCSTSDVPVQIAESNSKLVVPSKDVDNGMSVLSVSYVSGFVASKVLDGNTCCNCRNALSTTDPQEYIHSAIMFREYSVQKHGLTYPTEKFVTTIGKVANLFDDVLPSVASKDGVRETFTKVIKECVNFRWLQEICEVHYEELCEKICYSVCRVSLPWWCKKKNREIARRVSDRKTKDRKLKILQHT